MAKSPHPYAELFPMMNATALKELTASISEDGLQEPIRTFEGKVLDGRNRQVACSNAGIEPVYKRYTGDDALGYVIRSNLHRRHLTTSQRAMVAANLANMRQGERSDLSRFQEKISLKTAADRLSVGHDSVEKARKIIDSGDDGVIEAVRVGDISVNKAFKLVAPPPTIDTPPLSQGEQQAEKLLRLWDKTGAEGRKLFLVGIGVE